MPWPWWVYCIVPGTAAVWVLIDMCGNSRRTRNNQRLRDLAKQRMENRERRET